MKYRDIIILTVYQYTERSILYVLTINDGIFFPMSLRQEFSIALYIVYTCMNNIISYKLL